MTAWHQVNGLCEVGLRVKLYCGSCERPLPEAVWKSQTMKLGALKVPYRVLGAHRVYQIHDHLVARALRRNADGVDVVHCWPLASLKTLATARELGVPTLLERPNTHTRFAYEVVAAEHKKLGVALPRGNSHAYNEWRLRREEAEYALADRIACPSPFVAKSFRDRGFGDLKLSLHRYGYDPARFGPPVQDPGELGSGLVAAFVGRCEPRKGLHHTLEAWHGSGASRKGKLYICGSFIPGYREGLARLLDHPSIVEMGFVADMAAVMSRCHVLLLPTLEEGSALVTYEARASGCVLLVSDAAGAPCTHMHDSLVHPAGDCATLTRQLGMLLEQPSLFGLLRARSIAGIDSLSWHAAASRLSEVYTELLEGTQMPAGSDAPGPGLSDGCMPCEPR